MEFNTRIIIEKKEKTMEERLINDIEPHPENTFIYGKKDNVDDLVESIKKYGMDTPIKITADGVIISGHRRWNACKILKHETVLVIEGGSIKQESLFVESV